MRTPGVPEMVNSREAKLYRKIKIIQQEDLNP